MNAALVNKLERDEKPASIISEKNRTCEFFIQKAKLKNFQFLRFLHAITMIGYEVKILFQPSDFRFGTIKIDPC